MSNLKYILTSLLGLVALNVGPALGAPLTQAELTRVYNQVSMVDPGAGRRPAVVHDVVKGDLAVETGLESRAEMLFPDNTLTRLASNTYFSFKTGTREMDLGRGAILFQIPKGVGGAKINTAAITAAITGTTGFVERVGNTFKLVLLEGTVRVYLHDRVRESMIVHGGQMLIAPSDARTMRDWSTVNFDVAKMMKSSVLLKPELFKPLSPEATKLITDVITSQGGKVAGGELNPTNLVIAGGVSTVLLVDNNTRDRFSDPGPKPRLRTTATPTPSATATPTPSATATPTPSATATPTPSATATPTPTATATPTPSATATPSPTASPSATPIAVIPGPGALPTPDLFATPVNPWPITTFHPLPVSQVGQVVNSFFTFTTGGANPTWVKAGGATFDGTIYGGRAVDGPAGNFLFGAESTFGAQVHFDDNFGLRDGSVFPTAGVAIYKFDSIAMTGNPRFVTTGGPTDLAFVGVTGITGPGTWDLSGLHSLFLGTAAGSINLSAPGTLLAVNGTAPEFLHFYAENNGLGDVLLGTNTAVPASPLIIGLPSTSIHIDADHNAIIGKWANVTSSLLELNGVNSAQVDGVVTAGLVQMWSGGTTEIGGTVIATSFYGFGNSFTINGKLIADTIAIQTAGDFGVGATNSFLRGKDIYVNAGGTLYLNTANTAQTRFDLSTATRVNLNGAAVSLTGNVIVPAGVLASLHAGIGNLDGVGFSLSGFDSVMSDKNLSVGNLDARELIVLKNATVAGNLSIATTDITGSLTVGGAVKARTGDTASSPHLLQADRFQIGAGLVFTGASGTASTLPAAGGILEIDASHILFGAGIDSINGANFDGGAGKNGTLQGGGDGGTLNVGTDTNPIAGQIAVNGPISATTGANSNKVANSGTGGTVNFVANDSVTLSSVVKVSDSTSGRASSRGGNISVKSNKLTGTAINVTGTGQLLALLNSAAPGPGGTVTFKSAGGDIIVDGGKVQADRGTIDMQNVGANGVIKLTNATMSADVVKVGALGDNGQLIIGGGTINANTLLKLYAGGSNGTVDFVSNVSLNGNSTKIISANTVQINSGVVVTIGGANPAQVFTNNPNYTGSGGVGNGFGSFGGAGAATHPLSGGPGY